MEEREKQEIIKEVVKQVSILNKKVLTSEEASRFLGMSLSRLYKLTSARQIPHFKSPAGKFNYFNRIELEAWALRNRIATNAEISGFPQESVGEHPRISWPINYDFDHILNQLDRSDDPARRNLWRYLLKKPLTGLIADRALKDLNISLSNSLDTFLRANHIKIADAVYICSSQENFIGDREKVELHLLLNRLGLMQ